VTPTDPPLPTARRRLVRGAATTLLLAVVLLLGLAGPAAAHASLVSVDPPDGARLDEAPERVQLTFSEAVSAELGGVQVLDSNGSRVDEGATRVAGAVVEVDLRAGLPDGTFVISYRVVSADGHPARGGSLFAVGEGEIDADAVSRLTDAEDPTWDIIGGIGRWFAYAGTFVAAGGALFLTFAHRGGPERRMLVRIVRGTAGLGGVAALVALPVQAALGTGQGLGSLFDAGVLGEVAQDGLGHSLLLCLTGLLLLSVGVGRSTPITVVGSLVAAGSFAAYGHNRAGDDALLATLSDAVHLMALAVWVGGLTLLWLAQYPRHRSDATDPIERGATVARFSVLATAAILAVGATGAVLTYSQVRSLDALTSTRYGLLVVAKVIAVAGIVVLGAYNHFRLVPAMQRGQAKGALARLRSTLQLEVAGVAVVLALTAVLVVVTPGRTADRGGVVEQTAALGTVGSVQVVVSPAQAGFNQLHVYTYDTANRPAEIAESITIELSLPSADVGPIERDAPRAGPAHFQLSGSDLALGGRWQLVIRARIDRFNEAAATIEIPIAG
jgi:copper transport protein